MVLGVHCSVRHGYLAALEEARSLGCRAMQMLPYRRRHEPAQGELSSFAKARKESPVAKLVVHSRYVPCPGSSDEARRAHSRDLLRRELALAAGLGADAFVVHAGAYSEGASASEGLAFVAGTLGAAMSGSGAGFPVLVENVPGGGRRLCGALEELARLLEGLGGLRDRSGLCLDTAHAWAAGFDIASAEGMFRFLARVNRLFGAERVGAFHLADTKALLGTRREDHRHLGEGYLGKEGLKVLLERPEYEAAPAILETPRGPGSYARDLEFLKLLR
ncbi:MAG: deoxyribonuclease IV [Elusimicrobia bacterium]|nr:deoxyribonuclease IV [Elusimicrobiota bacterium]